MKNIPGPLAPPDRRRPNLKITALSYSFTTLTVTRTLRGKVTRTMSKERIVIKIAHNPGQSERKSAKTI